MHLINTTPTPKSSISNHDETSCLYYIFKLNLQLLKNKTKKKPQKTNSKDQPYPQKLKTIRYSYPHEDIWFLGSDKLKDIVTSSQKKRKYRCEANVRYDKCSDMKSGKADAVGKLRHSYYVL